VCVCVTAQSRAVDVYATVSAVPRYQCIYLAHSPCARLLSCRYRLRRGYRQTEEYPQALWKHFFDMHFSCQVLLTCIHRRCCLCLWCQGSRTNIHTRPPRSSPHTTTRPSTVIAATTTTTTTTSTSTAATTTNATVHDSPHAETLSHQHHNIPHRSRSKTKGVPRRRHCTEQRLLLVHVGRAALACRVNGAKAKPTRGWRWRRRRHWWRWWQQWGGALDSQRRGYHNSRH